MCYSPTQDFLADYGMMWVGSPGEESKSSAVNAGNAYDELTEDPTDQMDTMWRPGKKQTEVVKVS